MHNLNLSTKLTVSFLIVLLQIVVVGMIGVISISSLEAQYLQQTEASESQGAIQARAQSARMALISVVLMTLIIGSLVTFMIVRSVLAPIKTVTTGLSESAEQLHGAITQLAEWREKLAESADEIAGGMKELSALIAGSNSDDPLMQEDLEILDTPMTHLGHSLCAVTDYSQEAAVLAQDLVAQATHLNQMAGTIAAIAKPDENVMIDSERAIPATDSGANE